MMQMDKSRKERMYEEARRAKAIAVEKYKAGDFAGAKEFALKAKQLFPGICGILGLLAVLDVRMGFGKKINGEVDWYSVLSVDPTADHGVILQRYSHLFNAIVLDSDDTIRSIKEAMKIIDDAWKYFQKRPTVQPPLSKRSGGGSTRKKPPTTDLVIDQNLTPNMIQSSLVQKAKSKIKLRLEMDVPASQYNNVVSAAKRKTLQDSAERKEGKRVEIENKNIGDK